jgi:hypothetical protein
MKRKHEFIPSAVATLENRLVLSHATTGSSVVVSGLYPGQGVLNRRHQPVIAQVNRAFDSFRNDYDQARATYFASILNQPNPSQATTTAFTLYTTQRVSLLAQQLISSFLQVPQGTARKNGQPNILKQLITLRVIPTQGQPPQGSLAKALLESIPQPGSSAPTAALFSLSQDNAIETARVAVINGVNILKNGAFGIPKKNHF